jgi:preprotein translocase subunit SecA
MNAVGFTDETPIEAKLISRSFERAQSKVENHNYEVRKQVLEYDDVMNKQREVIYAERRKVLHGESLRDFMLQSLHEKVEQAVDQNAPENVHPSEWDLDAILAELELVFPIREKIGVEELEKLDRDGMKAKLDEIGEAAYAQKEAELTPEIMRVIESQYIMLPTIDRLWVDHLYVMDALKTGIGLRGYGQKDPRVEYEKEAYEIFEDLKNNIADEAIKAVFPRRRRTHGRRTARWPRRNRRRSDGRARGPLSERQRRAAELRSATERLARAAAHARASHGRAAAAPGAAPRPGLRAKAARPDSRLRAEAPDAHEPRRRRTEAPQTKRDREGRPQRTLPLRLGQEIQTLPRGRGLADVAGSRAHCFS